MLEVFALLNDILYVLNYGYLKSDGSPSQTNEWADAGDIDFVSLLKVNNNHFLKEIKKKLKESAVFYDQRYYYK